MTTTIETRGWLVYLDRRVVAMLFLGFSAGIPILLIFSTLGIWLREAGLDRSTITMFSWAALGYSFKFVWAPLIDRLPVPVLSNLLGSAGPGLLFRNWQLLLPLLQWARLIRPVPNPA